MRIVKGSGVLEILYGKSSVWIYTYHSMEKKALRHLIPLLDLLLLRQLVEVMVVTLLPSS
jgi:hypothetical protein